MKRTTWAPPGAGGPVAALGYDEAFDDRFPTQPIAVGRNQGGLVLDERHARAPYDMNRRRSSAHRRPPPSWQHHTASTGGVPRRGPARTAGHATRSAIGIAVAVVTAAIIGALGHQPRAAPVQSASPTSPATEARPTADIPLRRPSPAGDGHRGDRSGALGEADGVLPDGVTVFDEVPAVSKLDPELLGALRRAAADASDDGVTFFVNSEVISPRSCW